MAHLRTNDDAYGMLLPEDAKAEIEAFDDDMAREFMATLDEEPAYQIAPNPLTALRDCVQAFDGRLLETSGRPTLTTAGMLLAEFIVELEDRGVSRSEIAAGLQKSDVGAIETLLVMHKKLGYEDPEEDAV